MLIQKGKWPSSVYTFEMLVFFLTPTFVCRMAHEISLSCLSCFGFWGPHSFRKHKAQLV